MTCSSCGESVPVGARFCPSCGHTVVTRPDERRVATVLFADLVGFTTLSENADPERVKNLVDRTFAELATDVTAFGGHVDKVIGDALVAIFGAPVAHEDDAERAVRAALQMHAHLAELAEETGSAAQMRIGINTGEVLVGALRAGGDYTAMGDVVNVASRLQELAAPGQVVVGAPTRLAVRGIKFEALGPVTVKGREEQVDAYRAIEAVALPGGRGGAHRAPLIGRDAELTMLLAALEHTIAHSRANLALLVGEAGIGKTRLAAELGDQAECSYQARVLVGHCLPYGESNVWWPIGSMLEDAAGITSSDDSTTAADRARRAVQATLGLDASDPEIGRLADGLLYLSGRRTPSEGVDPTRAREDALRAAVAFLSGLADEQPLVIGLSDIQWADDALLAFLPRLLERLAAQPVMVVASTRPDAASQWTPPPGRHNTMRLNLDPLGSDHAAELLRTLLPETSAHLRDALRDRSGGNPFFIEELVAIVTDAPDVTRAARELPATLQGLVSARLDRLDLAHRAVLEDAAVIGTSGPIGLVRVLAGDDAADLDTALAVLVADDLLVVTDEQFRFRSQIAREVAYATLTKAERARRHGKLARTLAEDAEREGRVDEVIDQLAYHFDLATSLYGELSPDMHAPEGMYAGAVRFLERAAARAEQREDWKRAEAYLTHAIKLQPTAGGGESSSLRVARARARAEVRNLGGANDDLNTIFATSSEADADTHLFAEALTVLADVEYKEGNIKGSMQTFERAIERWRELGDLPGLADALRRCGLAAIFRSSHDQAREHLNEALEIFRAIGDRRGEAWALQNLAWAAFSSGLYDEAEVHLDASAALFGDLGDWGGVSWALGLLAWIRYTQGNLTEAASLAERTLREADELGSRWAGAMMRVLLANLHLWQGRVTKALDLAHEAQSTFVELGDGWGETQALSPQATALNVLGRFAESDAAVDALASVASRLDDVLLSELPMLQRIAIQLQRGAADVDPAGVEHLTTQAALGPASDDSRTVLGLVALQEGKAAKSVEILNEAAELSSGPGSTASVTAALALALVAAGRLDEALALCRGDVAVTYIDAYRLELAQAFAELRKGHVDAGRAALDRAIALVEPTESVLDRAAVQCAVAAFEGTYGSANELGMRMRGWETAFALMADRPG